MTGSIKIKSSKPSAKWPNFAKPCGANDHKLAFVKMATCKYSWWSIFQFFSSSLYRLEFFPADNKRLLLSLLDDEDFFFRGTFCICESS